MDLQEVRVCITHEIDVFDVGRGEFLSSPTSHKRSHDTTRAACNGVLDQFREDVFDISMTEALAKARLVLHRPPHLVQNVVHVVEIVDIYEILTL